jgi:hypothetical protein
MALTTSTKISIKHVSLPEGPSLEDAKSHQPSNQRKGREIPSTIDIE